MSSLTKSVILLVVILAIGAGLVVWKTKYGGHHGGGVASFNSLSKEEMELLLKEANPMMLKQLADNPELKKKQIENLKQLLAMASAAKKDKNVMDETTTKAMGLIDSVIWARTYDQETNKDKGPMPPFGFIGEDRVKAFYGEGENKDATQQAHEKGFEEFLKVQLDFARKNKAVPEDREPNEEELAQMRDEYAKIKIYEEEAKTKADKGELGPEFKRKVELQSKLQQAQFLARLYQPVLAEKSKVTDEDVAAYLSANPDLDKKEEKRVKANEVLERLKKGEDFAALAKEFSEDPGSKDKGGLYEGVTEGSGFDKTFEGAALALQPGSFTQELVETPFGFHIIKLEKKGGEAKDQAGQVKQTYDVRHILFSTMIKDPENPMARDLPVKDYARMKLEEEKEKKVLDQILAENPVNIAEDFQIPPVSDEQLQQMMQRQMQQQMPQQMPEADDSEAPPPPAKKPEAKKPEAKK